MTVNNFYKQLFTKLSTAGENLGGVHDFSDKVQVDGDIGN